MKIDLTKIRASDFEAVFGTDSREWQQAWTACGAHCDTDLWQMTIKDLGEIMDGRTPAFVDALFSDDQTARERIGVQKAVQDFIENFVSLLSKYSIRQTAEERQAAAGIETFQSTEGLLVFARAYFGLKSFSETEGVTLADVYLAKKDTYITAMFQKNLSNIQATRYKLKSK